MGGVEGKKHPQRGSFIALAAAIIAGVALFCALVTGTMSSIPMLRDTKKPKASQETSYFAQYKPHPDEGDLPAEGHLSREKAKSLTIIVGQTRFQGDLQTTPPKNATTEQSGPHTTLIGITQGPLQSPTQGPLRSPILQMGTNSEPGCQ